MIQRAARLLVATLIGVATGGVGVQVPASAAACEGSSRVTVVIDRAQLGGDTTVTCVSSAGGGARGLFDSAGVSMTFVSSEPGAVCRVQGAPASAGCVRMPPANAYWSLWWSTGRGAWTYATMGVDGLNVPAGSWIAWKWQGQNQRAQPRVTPKNLTAQAPAPHKTPTTRSAPVPSASSAPAPPLPPTRTNPSAGPSTSTAPAVPPAAPRTKAAAPVAESDSTSAAATAVEPASAAADGSRAPWFAGGVIALLAVSGLAALARRRS